MNPPPPPRRPYGEEHNGRVKMPMALAMWLVGIIVAGATAWGDLRISIAVVRERVTNLESLITQQHVYTRTEIDAMREVSQGLQRDLERRILVLEDRPRGRVYIQAPSTPIYARPAPKPHYVPPPIYGR
jgi:hypothetical protein